MGGLIEDLLGGIGQGVAELLVQGVLLLILFLLTLPLYFLMKKLSGRKTTLREDLKEAIEWRPDYSKPNPVVEELDKVQSGLESVYRYFLYAVIALVTGFIIWFFVKIRDDASRGFLQFYFGVGYLLFLLWSVGTLLAMRRRGTRRGARPNSKPAGFTWSFRLASQPTSPRPDPASVPGAVYVPPVPSPAKTEASPLWLGLTIGQWLIVVMVFSTVTVALVAILLYSRFSAAL